MSAAHNRRYENLLEDMTTALMRDEDMPKAEAYDVSVTEVSEWQTLLQSIHDNLELVEVPSEFQERLYNDLMGAEAQGVVSRVRGLPTRVHVATLTVTVGFVLILIRRVLGGRSPEIEEAPAV